jgi:UDP-N-acetylglucosamine pyrophosphorylase
LDNKLKIPIDSPESDLIGGIPPYYTNHFLELTVSAFDKENNNPYPSLRFDTNLYETYFKDIDRLYDEDSESLPIIECNMHIPSALFDVITQGATKFTLMNRTVMFISIDGFKLTQQENYNIPVKLLLI